MPPAAWQRSAQPQAARFHCWLLSVVPIRSTNRQQSRTDELDVNTQPADVPEKADPFVLADTQKAVKAALQELPEQQRIPLEMAYFQGMSHTEIATALGQPLGTVKDRIRNGMMHLRKRLKAYL